MSQMFPPDLAAALGGGGAPAPAGGGGLPPDLAALLGGGAPADAGPTMADGGSPGGGSDALGAAIDALHQALVDEADEEDKAVMTKCLAQLQGIQAKNQKEADSMMGGQAPPSAMRKAAAAQGGGV